MKKKANNRFKSYEGRKPSDWHIRLTKDMLLDPVYLSLSNNAKVLYSYIKLYANNTDTVRFARSLAVPTLFASNATFNKARDELIDKGFIYYTNKMTAKYKKEMQEYKLINKWIK